MRYETEGNAIADKQIEGYKAEWAGHLDENGNPVVTDGKISELRDYISGLHVKRKTNAFLMKYFVYNRGIPKEKLGIFKQYTDLEAPEFWSWNMNERTFDMVTDLVLKEAPLIILSGCIGYLAGRTVSAGVMAVRAAFVVRSASMARFGRYVAGGSTRLAREIAAASRWGGVGGELLVNGFFFEMSTLISQNGLLT